MGLTEHQQAAYDEVYERLASGERFTGLRGYAGTGKTYLAARLVERLMAEDCPVYVCAPTHKAVQVLREQMTHTEAPAQTVHSFLGLRLAPDGSGGYALEPDDREREPTAGVVIVDEASMIGRAEWSFIEKTPIFVQWLFVGDPAQLPPVNEDDSMALQAPGPTLTEVHRQAKDNPILQLATQIRAGDGGPFRSAFDGDAGVAITDRRTGFLDSILRAFQHEDGAATDTRVLAYRNKTVRRYNREIRMARYGDDAPRFAKDEWIVARESWYHEQVPILTNSEELRVISATPDTVAIDDMSEWAIWKLKVHAPGDTQTRTAHVLHEKEHERFQEELDRRRKAAVEEPSKWSAYYDLRERFARVDYAYASTVHKAQGSTYDTVFVDHRDLRACRGEEERALRYVAVTRPRRRLALLV
ncbi:ATP-dependent DNA helicase [Salisaeta longa]|uniref:ATP-dependent DNA helicase n=1 Tax=Salisaeta longa TaxID=503170 RepID=UPI00040FB16F|nr:AAA family ATPase [Salisaeta longa]